jgi:hypothetical protein
VTIRTFPPVAARLGRGLAAAGLLATLLGVLGACRAGSLARLSAGSSESPSEVRLTDRDLAPVDAWLDHERNAQWVLGDDVEVVASREYFGQALTVYCNVGKVERRDIERPDATIVELVYGAPSWSAGVTNSPRVLVGTGLNVSARRRLVVRLVKTRDPAVPVSLAVFARGSARRGRGEEVLERSDQIVVGGDLRRGPAGWVWEPRGAP